MTPYYQDPAVTLYHGDLLAVLKDLPDGAADLLLTDPPYSSGGFTRGDRTQDVHTKYVQNDSQSGAKLSGFSGDNRDQRAYGYWLALWLGECRRVLQPGSVVGLFTDWRQLPITTDTLQAAGYIWRGIVPWHKPGGRPIQGRWSNSCEYLVWGTNGPRGFDAVGGQVFPGFFTYKTPGSAEREHITQKPIELMRDLLGILGKPKPGGGGRGVRPLCRVGDHAEGSEGLGPAGHRRRDRGAFLRDDGAADGARGLVVKGRL